MNKVLFRESFVFLKKPVHLQNNVEQYRRPESQLLDYVLSSSQKGDSEGVIRAIDEFCRKTWMMNLGDGKAEIVKKMGFTQNTTKVIEIGGYCGYSALVFAHQIKNRPKAQVLTIEVNEAYANIARRIHQHAGVADIVKIHIGTVETSLAEIQQTGPFDMVFIDHVKRLYLSDLLLLQKYGVIQKGTIVVGDNIICPGAPDFLEHMKKSEQYESTLYHSHLEYSAEPDAVLVSIRL